MSGIILTSYYRSLTGNEIELNKQIKYYKAYWRKAKKQEKARLKEYGKRLDRYKIGDQVKVLFRLDTSKTIPRGYLIARHGSKSVNETVEIVGVIEDKEKDAEEHNFNLKIKIVEIKGYDEIQFGNNRFIKKDDVIDYSILNLPPEKL